MSPHFFACFGRSSSSSSNKGPSPENATADQIAEEQRRGGAVLVELFTSQGCSTSPDAELLLSQLGRGDFNLDVPVLVLAHHVDYWDHLGWKDPFASSLSTVRQKNYVESLGLDTLYTPQVVIQGRTAVVGTEESDLLDVLRSVPRFPDLTMQATFRKTSPDTLQVTFSGALRTKVDGDGANVMVALYENGVLTNCLRGSNKGRMLSNDFVVRKLEKLCSVKDISAKKTVTGTVTFPLWEGFHSPKCGLTLFVQVASYQIIGTQHFQLPDEI